MSFDHYWEVGVDLSESIIKNFIRRPLVEKCHDDISGLQENLNISEMVRDRANTTINTQNGIDLKIQASL